MQHELRLLLGYYPKLHEEPHIDGFFVTLVRDNMPSLTAATQQKGMLSVRECGNLADAMANIGYAAEAMGYPVVKATLDDIRAELPREAKAITPKQRVRIAGRLSPAQALIRDMICLAETGAI
ncbi:MAG: hypothetical protein WA056_08300 [Gallionella sp.]